MAVTNYPLISGVGNGSGSSGNSVHPNFASFPVTGTSGILYIDTGLNDLYLWTGTVYELQSSTGGGTWGSIGGTLSSQTDLQNALNAKDAVYGHIINPSRQHYFWTDFNENDRSGLNVAANTGGGTGQIVTNDSTAGANTTENVIGCLGLITGTGTTARLSTYGAGVFVVGNNKIKTGWRCALDVLSAANPTYTCYIGFGDNPGAGDMVHGVYFRYTHSVNGGRWEAVVSDTSVRSAFDTGVAPTANVFQEFEVEVNQAGTEAKFYIDGVLTNTLNSGLPGAGDFLRYINKIEKSAGATSVSFNTDWVYMLAERTTAR